MLFWLYQLLFPIVALGVLARLALDGRGAVLRETPRQVRQRLGLLSAGELARLGAQEEGVLWLHAASVGEVNAAAALLEALAAAPRRPKILLTSSTAAGQKRAQALAFPPDLAVLAPADFYPFIRTFLRRARPRGLLLIETELWPAMLRAAAAGGARIAIANGRVSERAFRRYLWIRAMLAPLLQKAEFAAVQAPEDASRFAALGVPEGAIRALGNLKNDVPPPNEGERREARGILDHLGWAGSPVWAAGSTWPEEEEAVLSAFLRVRREIPDLKLVLAPRHVERCGETRRLLTKLGIRHISFSESASFAPENGTPSERTSQWGTTPWFPLPDDAQGMNSRRVCDAGASLSDCLLVDRLGLLRGLYCACDAAFVGGTLNRAGGHNLLEPALASRPVLFGPHTESAQEAARALESGGGGVRVRDSLELASALKDLLQDKGLREDKGRRAAETALRMTGAARKTLEFLSPFLFPNS